MNAALTVGRDRWLIAAYASVCVAALVALWMSQHVSAVEAAALIVLLALLLPGLALLATRRAVPLVQPVRRPLAESIAIGAYLVVIAVVLVSGFERIDRIAAEPAHLIALTGVKLVVFVAVPAALLVAAGGYRISEIAPVSLRWRALLPALWLSLALLVFQAVVGRGLRDLRAAHLSGGVLLAGVPLTFAWLAVEAGLVEEFFFRAVLQSRLAALLRSQWGGLVISALLFGLVHAPGLYLRTGRTMEMLGDTPPLPVAIAYSVGITSLAGLCVGVLWMRTRNLAVVVLVHAAGDLLQGIVPWLKAFHLAH